MDLLEQESACSKRGSDPLSDFSGGDTNLTTSFPHVFMLGKGHGRSVPDMKLSIREHLLHQFTAVAAEDRRLLGFLFDVLQRTRVLSSVVTHVRSNPHAIQEIQKLMENDNERLKLKNAIKSPKVNNSRKLINKWLSLLKHVGRKIPYSPVEGKQLKHLCPLTQEKMLPHIYCPNCYLKHPLALSRMEQFEFQVVHYDPGPSDDEDDDEDGENGPASVPLFALSRIRDHECNDLFVLMGRELRLEPGPAGCCMRHDSLVLLSWHPIDVCILIHQTHACGPSDAVQSTQSRGLSGDGSIGTALGVGCHRFDSMEHPRRTDEMGA